MKSVISPASSRVWQTGLASSCDASNSTVVIVGSAVAQGRCPEPDVLGVSGHLRATLVDDPFRRRHVPIGKDLGFKEGRRVAATHLANRNIPSTRVAAHRLLQASDWTPTPQARHDGGIGKKEVGVLAIPADHRLRGISALVICLLAFERAGRALGKPGCRESGIARRTFGPLRPGPARLRVRSRPGVRRPCPIARCGRSHMRSLDPQRGSDRRTRVPSSIASGTPSMMSGSDGNAVRPRQMAVEARQSKKTARAATGQAQGVRAGRPPSIQRSTSRSYDRGAPSFSSTDSAHGMREAYVDATTTPGGRLQTNPRDPHSPDPCLRSRGASLSETSPSSAWQCEQLESRGRRLTGNGSVSRIDTLLRGGAQAGRCEVVDLGPAHRHSRCR